MKHTKKLTTREIINRIRRLMSLPKYSRNESAIGVYITEFREREDSDIVLCEDTREIENETYYVK